MNGQDLQAGKEKNHFSGDLLPDNRTHRMRSVPQACSGLVIIYLLPDCS